MDHILESSVICIFYSIFPTEQLVMFFFIFSVTVCGRFSVERLFDVQLNCFSLDLHASAQVVIQ